MRSFFHLHLIVFLAMFAARAAAQLPDTHYHTLTPSTGTPLAGAGQGTRVAMDGNLVVVSSPREPEIGGGNVLGVVRVYHFGSGLLLGKLARPATLASSSSFGIAIAISGNRVAVSSDNDDEVHLYDLGSATPLQPVLTITSPTSPYDDFGTSVALSGALLVVGEPRGSVGATTNAGVAHVYDLASATPGTPVHTLPNPFPRTGASFGEAVAISGSRTVIGAPDDDLGASSDAGSAYAYDLASATPDLATTLTNPAISFDDQYGTAVSISGTSAVIGAPGNTVGGMSSAGSAYVFNLASATPGTAAHVLDHPAPEPYEDFGSSIGSSGDGIVIGVAADDVGAVTDAGRVFIYNLTSGTPATPVAFFSSPSPAASDHFGQSVAASGTRVVVGAPDHDLTAPDGGAAWFYDLGGTTPLTPVAGVSETVPQFGDTLGVHVAMSGNRIVAGAPLDDTGAKDAGRAYVFDLSSATPLVPVLTLNNPTPAALEQFGYRVAVDGTRAAVSCFADIPTTTGRNGKIYIYDINSATPSAPVAELANPGPGFGWDQFGASLVLSGNRVIIGAPSYEPSGSGRVYVFDLGSPTPATPVLTITNPGTTSAAFGWSLSLSGGSLMVGAPNDDTGANNAGHAYLFDLNSATPGTPVQVLNNPFPNNNDNFGWAVGISGSGAAVGALYDGAAGSGPGRVHVYNFAGATPASPVATLASPNHGPDYSFGYSLSVVGNRVLVGTPGASLPSPSRDNAGRAYLFDLGSGTPLSPVVTYTHPSPAADDQFASCVALSGDFAVFGTPGDDVLGFSGRGTVQVFGPDPTLPEITVEEPDGNGLTDGVSGVDFGIAGVGEPGQIKNFTVRNTGSDVLTVSTIAALGGNPLNFTITAPTLPAQIAAGDSAMFTVQFSPNAAGLRSTTLWITSDDLDEAAFDVALTGEGYEVIPGRPDPNFQFDLSSTIYGIAPLPDGKTLVTGNIPSSGHVVRLNEDGSLDGTFSCSPDNTVSAVVANPDGTILIAGNFTSVSGTPRSYVAQLLAGGGIDPSFNADFNGRVSALAVQTDGRILACGEFTSVGGTGRNYVARLLSDGTLDTSFNANITFGASVQCVAVQPDGKILIGGPFFQIGGVFQRWLRRLNPDGTLDPGFNPALDQAVQALVIQADGRIVIGGAFTDINSTPRQRLARLNADGTLDTSFLADANQPVNSLSAQSDGRVVAGGFFTSVNGITRNRVARLNADGALDMTFDPDVNNLVYAVASRADGDVFVGGFFSSVGGQTYSNLARLDNGAAPSLLAVPDTGRVLWLRGGAAPEAAEVSFDLSTNGGATWTPLGFATRITGGWHKTGLSLPASASIRARARTPGSQFNGSGGIVESVLAYLNAPAPTGEIHITSAAKTGGLFIIDFTSAPGLTGWRMKGSLDLNGFPLDLNPVTTFQELAPGSYRATVMVPGSPQRLFFRIER